MFTREFTIMNGLGFWVIEEVALDTVEFAKYVQKKVLEVGSEIEVQTKW